MRNFHRDSLFGGTQVEMFIVLYGSEKVICKLVRQQNGVHLIWQEFKTQILNLSIPPFELTLGDLESLAEFLARPVIFGGEAAAQDKFDEAILKFRDRSRPGDTLTLRHDTSSSFERQ